MSALLLLASLAHASPWDLPADDEPEAAVEDAPAVLPIAAKQTSGTPIAPSRASSSSRASGLAPAGSRITPLGGGHGLALGESAVVGPGGGTNVTTMAARVAFEDYTVSLRLPFAAYRTPAGRTTDLGNLAVEALYLREIDGWLHGFGVEAHVNPAGRPYTWLHRADELWPGGGADLVYQLRIPGEGGVTWLLRGSAGLHGARAFAPFPGVYGRFGAAGAVDYQLPGVPGLGLVGETAIHYWDLSPLELTGLLRFDPVAGLRARGGVLLPAAEWLGWTPSRLDGGLREVTLHLDIQVAL